MLFRLFPEIELPLDFSERKILLATSDLILSAGGTLAALWYWTKLANKALTWELLQHNAGWMLAMCIGWWIWMFVNDLYELRVAAIVRRTLPRIGLGGLVVGGLYVIYFFATAPTSPDGGSFLLRLAPMLAISTTTMTLGAWRAIYALFLDLDRLERRVAIVGAGVTGQIIARELRQHPHYRTIGFIDDNSQIHDKVLSGIEIMGDRNVLRSAVERRIDEIVLAISNPVDLELLQLLTNCHERGIAISPMPLLYERLTGKVAIEHIGSQWYAALPIAKMPFHTFNSIGKRWLDLACGAVFGAIFLCVFPFIAIAIRLDSPGSIFYKQERVGAYGTKFYVYKFRSMVHNAEGNGKAQWAIKGDARITKVGKFIRKTRLDELPQILNVWRGEMSMVGPRPERHEFIQDLQHQIPFYRTRLAIKPGLTGWAQINYGYGSTIEDAYIKLQYDLYYLKHWSPWLDFKILLRTFAVVLKMQGQ